MAKKIQGGLRAAFNGFKETVVFEKNFKVMIIIALIVVVAMFYFPTSRLEKVVLFLAVFSVLILELINTTIERIMDMVTSAYDERVRIIKDLMAAIVLLASFGSAVVGVVIFWPYLSALFR